MQYIPALLEEEVNKLRCELLDGKYISFEFDTTPNGFELLCVVVTFVCSRNRVHRRCASLGFFAQHLNREDLARSLVAVLSTRYKVPFDLMLFACRDGAAVNGVATAHISVFAKDLVDVICWSHSLAIMGKEFNKVFLLAFRVMKLWSHLCSRCSPVRREFQELAGVAAKGYNEARWYCGPEVIEQMLNTLPEIVRVCRGAPLQPADADADAVPGAEPENPGALKAALMEVFENPVQMALLKMEMTAVVENTQILVKSCYLLEGDGFLAPLVYVTVRKIQAWHLRISDENLPRHQRSPSLWAQASSLYANVDERKLMFDTQLCKVYPAFVKLDLAIGHGGRLNACFDKTRGMRLFNHEFVATKELIVLEEEVIFLVRLPFVPVAHVALLKTELEEYRDLAVAHGPAVDNDLWAFWRQNELLLPTWFALARKIALALTSSARAERIFSMYNMIFSSQQDSARADYKEVAVMMRYNQLQREKYANI